MAVAVVVVVVVVDMAMVMVAMVVNIFLIFSSSLYNLIKSLFKVVGVTEVLVTEVIINSYNNHLNHIIPNHQI